MADHPFSSRGTLSGGIAALLFCFPFSTLASPAPSPGKQLLRSLKADMDQRGSGSNFHALLRKWGNQHGPNAVEPLLNIAANSKETDPNRYIALMGAAKLGGSPAAPKFLPLLKDRSWMIRNGALRVLSALKNPETSKAVLPLLSDPALVVRMEAVQAVTLLRPVGAKEALLETLENRANYHHEKAQWVPQRALAALVTLNARDAAPRLRPLLDHGKDPELQRQTVRTLEALTGKVLAKNRPLSAQISAWKKASLQ